MRGRIRPRSLGAIRVDVRPVLVQIADMTLTSAPQIATTELQMFVDRVMEALGHPDAFVTDESIVGDMLEIGGTAFRMRRGGRHSTDPWVEMPGDPEIARRNADVLRRASETLRIPLEPADRIVAVARRLAALGLA
jgi:hypothetical protein